MYLLALSCKYYNVIQSTLGCSRRPPEKVPHRTARLARFATERVSWKKVLSTWTFPHTILPLAHTHFSKHHLLAVLVSIDDWLLSRLFICQYNIIGVELHTGIFRGIEEPGLLHFRIFEDWVLVSRKDSHFPRDYILSNGVVFLMDCLFPNELSMKKGSTPVPFNFRKKNFHYKNILSSTMNFCFSEASRDSLFDNNNAISKYNLS